MSEIAPDPALKDYYEAEQFKKDIVFDMANLNEAMQRHASLYAHYATQAISAKRQLDFQSKKLELLEALLDREWRTALKEENPKTTEPQIRTAVILDKRYAAGSMREINAKSIYDLCRMCERSFDQQKDMLLQVARDANRESRGALRSYGGFGSASDPTAERTVLLEAMAAKAEASEVEA